MNIFSYEPMRVTDNNGILYYLFDRESSVSPFTKNEYDFDSNFYNGSFEFESPLTQSSLIDTPEAYGRHRIAAHLHESITETSNKHYIVLDIGAGSADLARILPKEDRYKITMVNSDISGPTSQLGDKSLLVRGMEKLGNNNGYHEIVNVQYDFNESKWPFRENIFDYICSNMALHHVTNDKKTLIAEKIFNSLAPGGILILNDVYDFNLERVMFTQEGKKGPVECTGYVESLKNTLHRLREVGFILSDLTLQVEKDENSYTETDLQNALLDRSEILPVSKAVWYLTATKP